MPKYGIGELVRFKASVLLVPAGRGSVKIGTGDLVGRITGSVETTGEETKYYVEVKLPDGTFAGVSDVVLKLTALESQIQSEKEHLDAKFDEFVKRVIPSFSPDPYSWIRSFLGCGCGPREKKSIDVAAEFADVLKKWENTRPHRYYIGIDLAKRPLGPNEKDMTRSHFDFNPSEETLDSLREFARTCNVHHADGGKEETAKPIYTFPFSNFAFPMTKDIIEEYEKKFNENARNIMKGVDSAVPGGDKNGVSVVDGKMSKSRCVKLLESYRAERDKVKKGRKFERCLRDSVVDEALERAIELLKGGAE